MPWARFDDEALDHPKLVDAGPEGELFWVRCIWYCNRHLTDGFVSAAMARRICNLGDVDVLLSRLVDLRLLEVVDGGYHIHDYLEYNFSADEVVSQRADNARRQDQHRKRHRRLANSPRNAVSNAVTNGPVTAAPYPYPYPDPVPAKEISLPESQGGIEGVQGENAAMQPPPAAETETVHELVPEPVATMHATLAPLNGYEPSPQYYAKVAGKYGHLDLEEESLKIAGWCRAHPKRLCSTSFVLNWLRKAAADLVAVPVNGQVQARASPNGAGRRIRTVSPIFATLGED